MAAPTTSLELMDLLRKSELLPEGRAEAFAETVRAGSAKLGPRDLAALMVSEGLVTQFQAEQLLQGKWKGFTIGKYRVLERIGAGGMGTVYLCEHATVGRKVAVKVLPTSQSENATAKARFYREARAAGVLNHPNLVKAHDVDEENGVHFLVMDYVDGNSLQAIVGRFGPLPVPRAANYILQAARGLQAAHEAGLIHRDVKPANIMVERNGTIRLLDLGLARFYHDTADLLTLKYNENTVLGTADYVAPEQAVDSHDVDIRADIYSLGATFYYLLTGQTAFPTGRISQKLIWLQVRQPTPVRDLRPEVPAGLAAVIDRMMAKKPEDRFSTPAEVAEALTPWADTRPTPPPEHEMPRLSPAALAAGSGSGPGARVSSPQYPKPRKSLATAPIVFGAQALSSGPALRLARAPAESEQATPQALSELSPTTVDQARPAGPRAPSRLPAPEKAEARIDPAPPAGPRRSLALLWATLLVVLCSLIGIGLAWVTKNF